MTEVRHDHAREVVREGVTMALYLSLSLLAVVMAVPTGTLEESPLGTMVVTAIGLLIAHLLAFSISSRLVSQGVFDAEARRVAAAQIVAGLLLIAVVAVPMILFEPPLSVVLARLVLLAVVMVVAFFAARQAQASMVRSLVYVAVVFGVVMLVLAVKSATGH